jgi:hypothetical protein
LEGQIIFDSHWFTKDEETIDWREGFPQLPLDKKNKLKERSWETLGWGKNFYLVFFLKEEKNECVRGELVCYM